MSDKNRVGEACWYRPADFKEPGGWRGGTMRHWSTDWEDHGEHGFASFPVGVIEDDDTRMCHSVYVTRICFSAEPPK